MELQYKIIGQRIKTKRTEMKIRQNELAETIDISSNHLSGIENGREKPSLETLVNICVALNITPNYLILGNTHPPNVPESVHNNLQLCSKEDIELARRFSELLVERNANNRN